MADQLYIQITCTYLTGSVESKIISCYIDVSDVVALYNDGTYMRKLSLCARNTANSYIVVDRFMTQVMQGYG